MVEWAVELACVVARALYGWGSRSDLYIDRETVELERLREFPAHVELPDIIIATARVAPRALRVVVLRGPDRAVAAIRVHWVCRVVEDVDCHRVGDFDHGAPEGRIDALNAVVGGERAVDLGLKGLHNWHGKHDRHDGPS